VIRLARAHLHSNQRALRHDELILQACRRSFRLGSSLFHCLDLSLLFPKLFLQGASERHGRFHYAAMLAPIDAFLLRVEWR